MRPPPRMRPRSRRHLFASVARKVTQWCQPDGHKPGDDDYTLAMKKIHKKQGGDGKIQVMKTCVINAHNILLYAKRVIVLLHQSAWSAVCCAILIISVKIVPNSRSRVCRLWPGKHSFYHQITAFNSFHVVAPPSQNVVSSAFLRSTKLCSGFFHSR